MFGSSRVCVCVCVCASARLSVRPSHFVHFKTEIDAEGVCAPGSRRRRKRNKREREKKKRRERIAKGGRRS